MNISKNYIAIPPGYTIKEQLIDRGMKQKEFASRMGFTEKHVSKLINGEVQLTVEVARKLEMIFDIPTQFWCNLESMYREDLIKVKEENEILADLDICKKFPYNEMAKNGWIENTKDAFTRIINLRKFFEISQLTLLKDDLFPNVMYRKLSMEIKDDSKLIAWAQKAKLEARKIETEKININKLDNICKNVAKLSVEKPELFCPKLVDMFAECGVALVFLPHIKGSFLHGATFIDNNKIVMGLTVRGKDADKFWFSLLHEIGHVVNRHFEESNDPVEVKELAADMYARNALIDEEKYIKFVNKGIITEKSITEFANELEIDKGIIVGRLQKDNFIPYSAFNELKTKYVIIN